MGAAATVLFAGNWSLPPRAGCYPTVLSGASLFFLTFLSRDSCECMSQGKSSAWSFRLKGRRNTGKA